MKKLYTILSILFLILGMGFCSGVFAEVPSEVSGLVSPVSIGVTSPGTDPIVATQNLGFRILGVAKLIVSGLALIWIVLIGAYMVVFSENEERVKSQKMQLTYSLIGFLFLNIPGIIFQIFFSTPKNGANISDAPTGGWSSILGGFFWDDTIATGFVGNLIGFFQVFIFGIAVLTFTWGLFRLIVSAGDEEVIKKAKNMLIYGTLGLLFVGFVRFWGMIIAIGDFSGDVASVGNKIFALALYFAGPIAIFFLIWGGYYYITSGGDEERTKKGKNIIVNTFIATLILLAGYSFVTDLIKFTA